MRLRHVKRTSSRPAKRSGAVMYATACRASSHPASETPGRGRAERTSMKMQSAALAAVLALSSLYGCRARAADAPVTLQTDDQKTLYALGHLLGRNVGPFNLTPAELEIVKKGLTDSVTGKKPE